MTNLQQRVLTALTAGVVVVGLLYWSLWGLLLVSVLISVFGLWEYLRLVQQDWRRPLGLLTLALAAGLWALAIRVPFGAADRLLMGLGLALMLAVPALLLAALYDDKLKQPFERVGLLTLGLVYAVVPLIAFYGWVQLGPTGAFSPWMPLGLLSLFWASDTLQYFTGRAFGRRKLFPSVSPGKTWEGAIGGVLGCIALGFGYQYLWPLSPLPWPAVAAWVGVGGTLGDLVESRLKRSLGVKDSGTLLPGHGGVLDRFDGWFVVLPVLFAVTFILIFWTLF
jgi:phosphatidate cytidylyltransferase